MQIKNPEVQIASFLEILSLYDMKIEHQPEMLQGNADGLSIFQRRQKALLWGKGFILS